MPPFIERRDDPQIPPPYILSRVEIRSFELSVNPQALRDLCDKILNIGGLDERRFEYRPLMPFAALEVLTYPSMLSETVPFSSWGYIRQQEVYIRVPVVRYELAFGMLVPVAVSQFFPFIVVDNTWSAFSGREVIGMPKVLGDIKQKTADDDSFTANLEIPVFKVHAPETPQTMEQAVKIKTGRPGKLLDGPNWPWVIAGFDALFADTGSLLFEMWDLISLDAFSTAQLKQIRDAEVATEACFQAIVQSDFSVRNPKPPIFFESANVTFMRFASFHLASELGLPADQPIKALLAYSTECDMEMSMVRNLFIRRL